MPADRSHRPRLQRRNDAHQEIGAVAHASRVQLRMSFAINSVSKAIKRAVNGVAALPKDWTNKTRLGSPAGAFAVKISANAANCRDHQNELRAPHFPDVT